MLKALDKELYVEKYLKYVDYFEELREKLDHVTFDVKYSFTVLVI